MSEEMEKQPVQATNAPFRRRRASRRRGGRRNESERPAGSSSDNDGDTTRTSGPETLENGTAVEVEQRQSDRRSVETANWGSENRISEEQRDRSEGGSQNGEQPPREPEFGEGIIEISGKGFGFLRDAKRNFIQTPQDIFVTPEIVRRFQLRDGMWIYGETRRGNRGPQLIRLLKINDEEPTKYQDLRPFEELTTINPNQRIQLETVPPLYDADHLQKKGTTSIK